MQVTETLSQGLKREFQVVLPATELEERLTSELSTLKGKVQIKGFRPGKVPVAHLRRLYGKAVLADVLRNAMSEAERRIVDENGLRLANQPDYSELPQSEAELAEAAKGEADLAFKVALEVLPRFELADLSDISIRRLVAEVSEAEVDQAVERMRAQNRPFVDKGEGAAAQAGDRVTLDFTGRVGGEPFEGGTGEGVQLELGSGSFIPGFEDGLLGIKAGETRTVTVTFPEDYGAAHLAGKEAEFEATAKAVERPEEVPLDDAFAQKFGMESLDKLREAVRGAIERDFAGESRRRLKKELLDALDAKYSFDLPPTLVEQEFAGVWSQVMQDLQSRGRSFADEGTTEEAAKAEYRGIAERRVRLGLVLAQVGESADIKVADDEVTQALVERVRQYPGREKQVWDYYRQNPQALAEIRAPLFEEKVVDHVLTQVKVVDEPVSKDALFADDEESGAGAGTAKGEGA